MRGSVASGHPLTTQAGIEMLRKGGNAFDALVSAAFASCVSETGYATLGGGGFILGHIGSQQKDFLYDCFVNFPGLEATGNAPPEVEHMTVHFAETTQDQNIGMASIAVHGLLKGLIHCYKKHCTLDLDDIIATTLNYLRDGVVHTQKMEEFFEVVRPIYSKYAYGKEIFSSNKKKLYNPLFKEFIELRSIDQWLDILYQGEGAKTFLHEVASEGGMMTQKDLDEYQVIERTPLRSTYRDYEIITNPLPSIGGSIVCESLQSGRATDPHKRAEILRNVNRLKGAGGTTHISVIDNQGNAVGISISGGFGSGYFYPDTGILMNNMLGELDLHAEVPDYVHAGNRVTSMMTPLLIKKNDDVYACLGSGGSTRIRSTVLQVIWNLLEDKMTVKEAINAPRMHFDDDDCLHFEPLDSPDTEAILRKAYPNHHSWSRKYLYFGGLNAVMGNLDGWGDQRRDGTYSRTN